jgi:protein-tyrosine-phosphatase
MAESYFSKRAKELKKNIEVASAGTGAIDGFTPTDEAIKVMKEIGIDISGYKSSALTKDAIENADTILVMEPRHKDRVLELVPAAGEKIFFLSQFGKEQNEPIISDPIGKTIVFYRMTRGIIKESIDGFIEWLENKK